MAKVNWTAEQQNFITAPNGPILVSAAAGSGKTAAVVERVITRLCDEQNPLYANRLLMTTFSNAAASEMISRIDDAISKKILSDPDNTLLYEQQEALQSAQISTIHAFCLKYIRENFSRLGIFCDFKILDNTEKEILMQTALKTVVSNAYAKNSPEFLQLVELVCGSKDDMELLKIILSIYEKVIAMPFPDDVLNEYQENIKPCKQAYDKCLNILFNEVENIVKYADDVLAFNLDLVADGKNDYVTEDIECMRTLKEALSERNVKDIIAAAEAVSLGNTRVPRKMDPQLRQSITTARKAAKEAVHSIPQILDYTDYDCFISDQNLLYAPISCLFSLVKDFIDEFAALKREKNMLDFSDAEQFMISLVWNKDDNGNYVKTDIAENIKNRFDEIYIDEYQDTNAAQEMIFKAITRDSGNIFMVGDVKQSIYGFRQADAELFEQKKKDYRDYDGKSFPSKIFFDRNFRSRKGVTEFINDVFSKIMTEETCGMDYTEADKLKAGAKYFEREQRDVSLLFYESEKGSREKIWLADEAQLIAKYIKGLVESGYMVKDGDGTRPCNYGDFCILARADSGRFSVYSAALDALNIDNVVEKDGESFLQSREMLMIRAILKSINNPFDDIALCGAMISPAFLFTPTDLAEIRTGRKQHNKSLFAAVKEYAQEGNVKCIEFIDKLRQLQRLASGQSVDSLLCHIYNNFGLYNMIGAMSGGETRTQNLDTFRYYARRFEQNGHRGLGEFIKFVERSEKNEDKNKLKAADTLQENLSAVKITTIHKSKGLEFPICILANSLKSFYKKEIYSGTIINKKLGIGVKIKDSKRAVSYAPLFYRTVKRLCDRDIIGEEMRVLYVALTRAKENLTIPFVRSNMGAFLDGCAVESELSELSYGIQNSKNYASWIMLSAIKSGSMKSVCQSFCQADFQFNSSTEFDARIVDDISAFEAVEEIKRVPVDEKIVEKLKVLSGFKYPYEAQSKIASHYSVSEIAKGTEGDTFNFDTRPEFMYNDKMTGAMRGTALHTFMQFANFKNAMQDINSELENSVKMGYISQKQCDVIDREKLNTFFNSPLCKRIMSADEILREYKFTSGVNSASFGGIAPANDIVLIQGVADIVIVEGDKATVIDYKTDYVKTDKELVDRYSAQLSVYCTAIQKLLNKRIDECIIYSFSLGKEITFTPDKEII